MFIIIFLMWERVVISSLGLACVASVSSHTRSIRRLFIFDRARIGGSSLFFFYIHHM